MTKHCVCIAFLAVCEGMFVYQMPGWEESFGLNWEITHMKALGKPIVYLPFEGERE